jgi:tRNA A37 threonylcarbamoyladenosine modification protein TsaB
MTPLSDALLVDEKGKKALAHGAKIVETAPRAADVAALAHDKWMRGEREWSASPLYIREPDAKLPVG